MDMKDSKDVLGSLVKTAQMGQTGLDCVLAAPLGPRLRQCLQRQHQVYQEIQQEAQEILACRNWQAEELSPMSRVYAKMATKMKLAGRETDSRGAAMVIQGSTKGLVKGTENLRQLNQQDTAVSALAQRLLDTEAESIRQMQSFL